MVRLSSFFINDEMSCSDFDFLGEKKERIDFDLGGDGGLGL